ncbi:retrovirus-related pol polyprotein from transposon TNT 1-94 [Tanacetum coccineum]
MLSSFLISNDFSKGSVDPTLFIRREGNDLILVQIYVDDIIFAASTPELCDLFAKIMCSKFKMSMMGKISFFLGLQISQSPRGIFINQSKYALESLKKYGYESCDPVDTPMVEKSKLDEDKEGKARPESLQFAICMCARYQARPTEKHLNAVKRIFRYLKGTVHRGLWYPKDSSFALTAFADADHAGCQDTRRSTSGSIQLLGDRLVSWSSKRQKSAAISSTEAEYIALSGCCAQVLWMRSQLTDYGFGFNKKFNVLSKILDIGFISIKEHVEDGGDRTLGIASFAGYSETQLEDEVDEYGICGTYSNILLMALSIADQIALDDALVAPADRLKIGKCNLRLSSDVTSKEATLQVVYDVLKLTPFYKAFQVTADAPEIYMQEFWASAYVHNRSVRFKMNNKKHIIGLEQFRDILQICPKVGNKKFVDPPLEKEIIIFLASLGHSGDIRKLSDVNVNKLHQPWRSFAAVINKCLCGTPSYDSLRLSQAQILWGQCDLLSSVHPTPVPPTKTYGVMEKDPSITRRNKVNWHYARDDPMFTTINVISRKETTQLYGAILPVALTNEDIRNSESYKEYYAMASGTIPPKTKGSKKKANTEAIPKMKLPTAPKEKKSGKRIQKTTELENISEADLTEAEQLKIVIKRSRQETHSSHASGSGADEGTGVKPGVPDAPEYDSEDDISWKSSDDDQDDEQDQDDDDAEKHDVHETTQEEEEEYTMYDEEYDQEDDEQMTMIRKLKMRL